jgi:hypothetical protein
LAFRIEEQARLICGAVIAGHLVVASHFCRSIQALEVTAAVVVICVGIVVAREWNHAPSSKDQAGAVVLRGEGVEVDRSHVHAARDFEFVADAIPVGVVVAHAVAIQELVQRECA